MNKVTKAILTVLAVVMILGGTVASTQAFGDSEPTSQVHYNGPF